MMTAPPVPARLQAFLPPKPTCVTIFGYVCTVICFILGFVTWLWNYHTEVGNSSGVGYSSTVSFWGDRLMYDFLGETYASLYADIDCEGYSGSCDDWDACVSANQALLGMKCIIDLGFVIAFVYSSLLVCSCCSRPTPDGCCGWKSAYLATTICNGIATLFCLLGVAVFYGVMPTGDDLESALSAVGFASFGHGNGEGAGPGAYLVIVQLVLGFIATACFIPQTIAACKMTPETAAVPAVPVVQMVPMQPTVTVADPAAGIPVVQAHVAPAAAAVV